VNDVVSRNGLEQLGWRARSGLDRAKGAGPKRVGPEQLERAECRASRVGPGLPSGSVPGWVGSRVG
jgi:hypothetical protein